MSIKQYVIWNPEKLSMDCNLSSDSTTLEGLFEAEKTTGYNYSSIVTTDDIDALIDAIINETDTTLGYATLEEYNKTIVELGR